jgi:hypothetical protein
VVKWWEARGADAARGSGQRASRVVVTAVALGDAAAMGTRRLGEGKGDRRYIWQRRWPKPCWSDTQGGFVALGNAFPGPHLRLDPSQLRRLVTAPADAARACGGEACSGARWVGGEKAAGDGERESPLLPQCVRVSGQKYQDGSVYKPSPGCTNGATGTKLDAS